MANYSFSMLPIPEVENGHTFEGDNFIQLYPHTAILVGVTGLKFIKCNLTNCDIPADATHDTAKGQVSFCSHVHPNWVAKGLTECTQDCEHLVITDTIVIDGVTIDTVYHYEDKVVG